jgi:hypothetical protein
MRSLRGIKTNWAYQGIVGTWDPATGRSNLRVRPRMPGWNCRAASKPKKETVEMEIIDNTVPVGEDAISSSELLL